MTAQLFVFFCMSGVVLWMLRHDIKRKFYEWKVMRLTRRTVRAMNEATKPGRRLW